MTYVDYHCEAPRAARRLMDLAFDERILFVDCRHELTRCLPSDVLAREGYIDGAYDLLVLRGGPGFARVVDSDHALQDWSPRSVVILEGSDDPRHREPLATMPHWADDETNLPSLEQLREIELWGLVMGRGALLGEPGEHFQLRSGNHIKQYLRLRDACVDPGDAQRLADWLLPYVDQRTVVLGDRPNMGMLVQAVALLCKRRFDWDVEVATLDPWPRNERSSAQVIAEIGQRGTHILAVLGADHASRHERELALLSRGRATAVCLVDITPEGPTSQVAFRHHPIPRWPQDRSGRCAQCQHFGRLSRIDPRKEDVVAELVRQPAKVVRRHWDRDLRLWQAVQTTEALTIHNDVEYDDGARKRRRHRPIHVNMPRLLLDGWFREVCRRRLRALDRPDLVIVPAHAATPTLRNIMSDIWGESITRVTRTVPRGGLPDELRAELPEAERILFVDDALITGQTLVGLVEAVCDTLAGSERDHQVMAFVALCCPADDVVLNRLRSRMAAFGESERLHWGRLAYLPDGGSCAFCFERRWLESLQHSAGEYAPLVRARLRELGRPIDDATLLFRSEMNGAGDPRRGRGAGTPPASASSEEQLAPAVAYAAAASAAQGLRREMRRDGQLTSYLDTRHTILRYAAAPVLAGILRTFTEDEVNYDVGAGLPLEAIIEGAETISDRALAEIGWAAVTDKLPVAHAELVDAAMRRGQRDRVVLLMRHLLRQRTASQHG